MDEMYLKILEKANEEIDGLNEEIDRLKAENDVLTQKLKIIRHLSGQTAIHADINSPLPPPIVIEKIDKE